MEKKNEFNISGTGLLSFDPIVLLQDVLKRWLVIVLAALAVGVGSYISTDSAYVPQYRTNTIFVVTTRGSSTTVYSNLTSTSNVASLFTELLNSSIMRKTVMEEMGVSSLDAQISTSVIPNTNLITMTVTSGDPRTAFLTAQTLIDNHETLTYAIVDGIVMEVLQHPSVPTGPINHADAMEQMKRMGVLAGLAAAAALAVLSFLRDVVRSGTEAQAKLDCDYLGEIPHEKKYKTVFSRMFRRKTSILIDNPVTSFRYVETLRKLRRRVEQHMDGGKVVMVTSLLENEGKSTVAANIALTLAQKSDKVILLDGDMRRPAVYKILEKRLKREQEIGEYLKGNIPLDGVIHYDKPSGLHLLIGSKHYANSTEMVSGERLRTLMKAVQRLADYVVIDSPPTSLMADAEVLAEYADVSLLVVRQGMASARFINDTIDILDNGHSELLGCIFNDVKTGIFSGRSVLGGYGYRYGYGRYGRYGYGKYGYGKNEQTRYVKPQSEIPVEELELHEE